MTINEEAVLKISKKIIEDRKVNPNRKNVCRSEIVRLSGGRLTEFAVRTAMKSLIARGAIPSPGNTRHEYADSIGPRPPDWEERIAAHTERVAEHEKQHPEPRPNKWDTGL